MMSFDAVGWLADIEEKRCRDRNHDLGYTCTWRRLGQRLSRYCNAATFPLSHSVLCTTINCFAPMMSLSVLRTSLFSPAMRCLSTIVLCQFPVAAIADGQIVILPNLDAKLGIGLPYDDNIAGMLSTFEGAGVSVVTPRGGTISTIDLDAEATGIPADIYRQLRDRVVLGIISGDDMAHWSTRRSTVNRRSHIDFGAGLVIQVPVFDSNAQTFRGSDGEPFDFGGILTSLDKSLPGHTQHQEQEFRDLVSRLGTLNAAELKRLKELYERGISVPSNTVPVTLRKVRHPIVVRSSPDCPNGKKFPSYCRHFELWKPPQCTCD